MDHDVNYQKSDHGSGDKQKDQIDTSFVDIQLEQQLLQGSDDGDGDYYYDNDNDDNFVR